MFNIQREATDQATTLNNRANIRALMGTKSYENQEKKRAEKENKEKLAALEEARKQNIERQEEIKISKYMGKHSGNLLKGLFMGHISLKNSPQKFSKEF